MKKTIVAIAFLLILLAYPAFGVNSIGSNMEETEEWNEACTAIVSNAGNNFPADYDVTGSCDSGFVETSLERRSGTHSLKLTGAPDEIRIYKIGNIPIEGSKYYKIRVSLKIENMATYSYLDYDYPSWWTNDAVKNTKGVWSGRYYIKLNDHGQAGIDILPSKIAGPYRAPSDIGWFEEETYFKTFKADATETNIIIRLEGFKGKLYIDNLTIEEVDSYIDEKYLGIPIETEFQGMRIKQLSTNPLFVETNAAKFSFQGNKIVMEKNGAYVSEIEFGNGFLNGLTATQEQGTVFIKNDNVKFSIGADSVLIAKLINGTSISVKGNKANYSNFEAGIIFATDYDKGILFSPIRTRKEINEMQWGAVINAQYQTYSYNDSWFQTMGLKFWNVVSGFSGNWQVDYDFQAGSGFIAEVFPPKEFDEKKYCNDRRTYLSEEDLEIDLVNGTEAFASDFSYFLQKFKETSNIGLIWMNHYAENLNDQNPPTVYCTGSDSSIVQCSSGTTQNPLDYKTDVTGPYEVREPAASALRRLTDDAQKIGVKVILYMTPHYYYTYNVDTFLQNLRNLIDNYGVDGVYYDGLYQGDALRSLELVRKTRNLLGDKFYEQHNSWNIYLLPRTHKFRAPFLDAYADQILDGETMKVVDDDTWRLYYCGRNVSNTASRLLPEVRPPLDAAGQINKTLECNGLFGYLNNPRKQDHLKDGDHYDSRLFLDPYNSYCLSVTCGDGICDIGETINNCQRDCAPPTSQASLSKNGNTYTCNTNHSVAQWMVNGQPLYKLHFTFDNETASEESENKINPNSKIGITYASPAYRETDGEKTLYFDGTATLFGKHYGTLNLSNNFSSFARIKPANPGQGVQQVFTPNSNDAHNSLYYGINTNSKLVVALKKDDVWRTVYGETTLDQGWHSIGIVYEKPKLRLYVDGTREEIYENYNPINATEVEVEMPNFSAESKIYTIGSTAFKGYIDDLFFADQALTDEQAMQYQENKHKTITANGTAACIITNGTAKFTAGSCNSNAACEPELGESTETCPSDCQQECIRKPELFGYIEQWERGEISMLALMQKLQQWKAGTGCPTPA